LLTEPGAATAVRNWIARPFLIDVLPTLLNNIERGVADLVRSAYSAVANIGDRRSTKE
jgi:hypothetical protein